MIVERQVETIKAYIFGHYDSRGGGFLVLADNHIQALEKYIKEFGWDDEEEYGDFNEEEIPDALKTEMDHGCTIDNAQDDFIRG